VIDDALVEEFSKMAGSRPILSFLGSVTASKGINMLANIILEVPSLCDDVCVLIAGKVDAEAEASVDAIAKAGGIVINRRIADTELYAIYHASSAIWCCYQPEYDIASGIFGRAMQFGKRPAIRAGAVVVSYYDQRLKADAIRVVDDPMQAANTLRKDLKRAKSKCPDHADQLSKWRSNFLSTVRLAL
jgi:hypothetical protein